MRLILTLFLISVFTISSYAIPQKQAVSEMFTLDTYSGDTLNLNQLIGYYLSFYLTGNLSFTVGTSWAITGQYGGYGTATFGPQYSFVLSDRLSMVVTPMIGVGGHAALPLGNGVLYWAQIGIDYAFTHNHSFLFNYGFMDYIYGDYQVTVICAGVKFDYDIFLNRF